MTDNGNVILDVHGMEILDPIAMENAINAIPGVVTVGLFANRGADVALIGTPDGIPDDRPVSPADAPLHYVPSG